jgi:hypothetical protein
MRGCGSEGRAAAPVELFCCQDAGAQRLHELFNIVHPQRQAGVQLCKAIRTEDQYYGATVMQGARVGSRGRVLGR